MGADVAVSLRPMSTLPLSIALTAQNEELNLPRCLDSVRNLQAAEIVLVDSGSTDRTLEIAAQYGARIHSQSWLGHSQQKACAIQQCSQPWVLVLDCDEALSPELRSSIQAFFAQGLAEKHSAASLNRLTWFMGRWIRHGDWYPDRKLRLLRREVARSEGNAVHDRLTITHGSSHHLTGDLHHYSFVDTCHHLSKHIRYTDQAAELDAEKGNSFSAPMAFSRALWRFIRAYVLRRGFLDGFPGFWIATATAFFTLQKNTRLFERAQQLPGKASSP
jgi:glycosyltransferase involved in cell wall biosynthesis